MLYAEKHKIPLIVLVEHKIDTKNIQKNEKRCDKAKKQYKILKRQDERRKNDTIKYTIVNDLALIYLNKKTIIQSTRKEAIGGFSF